MGKAVKTLADVGTFGLAGKLLSGGKKKAAAPGKGPVVMPLADDEAVKAKRRKSVAEQIMRQGRSSTILTNSSETLGGGY